MKVVFVYTLLLFALSCSTMRDNNMLGPKKEKIHKVSCEGKDMEYCFDEARKMCNNRYQIVSEDSMHEKHHPMNHLADERHLFFYCK